MEAISLGLILAIAPLIMATFAFPAIFKLKFIKHKVWLVLLYSLISAAAATVAIVCGAMILYASVWMAIGGGAAGVTTFIGISGSVLLLILIAINSWILVSYGKICPNCFEPAPKLSIILASAAVVLLQGALMLIPMAMGPVAFNKLTETVLPFAPKAPRLLFGYIDKSGKFAIKPAYGEAEKFHNGRAIVWPENAQTDFVGEFAAIDEYEQIDKAAKVVARLSEKEHDKIRTEFKYKNPEDYCESIDGSSSFGILGREIGWQETRGIPSNISEKFFEGFATKQGSHYGRQYFDKNGKLAIAQEFNDALRFNEGLAAVQVGNGIDQRWGYIDKAGKFVIQPIYAKASPFHEGLACVGFWNDKMDNRYSGSNCDTLRFGYINKQGKFVIPPIFMHAYSFSEGLAAARIDVNNPPDVKKIEDNLLKQQESDKRRQEKDLASHSGLCVQSWRDGTTWAETAGHASGWLDMIASLKEPSDNSDKLLAYEAAIYSICYPAKLAEAEKSALRALALNKSNALAHGVLGHCLSLKRQPQAIVEFGQAIYLEPRNAEWYANRGLCYEDSNNTDSNDKAIADYSKMISLAPQSAWAYGSRAHAYLAKNKTNEAIEDINKALKIEPNNNFSLKQLADAQTHLGHFDEALKQLALAEECTNKDSPDMVELLSMRATIFEYQGKKVEAQKLRKEIAEKCRRFNEMN
ncbi:WG repeat-containing protein [bacterium]|nr:WG repeat-containing protein [bacterium]